MNVGTKSLLFGVHQFLWHPWTVGRAYRHIYKRWPTFEEWLCILVHDWGYWGSENMDGEQGKKHPERGALIACTLVYYWYRLKFVLSRKIKYKHLIALMYAGDAFERTLYHSSHYVRMHGAKPSSLYLPDKVSILFEPRWWYLLRAKLSGEIYEYIENSPFKELNVHPIIWYFWYRNSVKRKLQI